MKPLQNPAAASRAKILALAKRDKEKFAGVLAENGYFWDVNKLRDRFKYDTVFSPLEIKRRWGEFFKKSEARGPVPVDFYLHIPFCVSRCEYCLYFRSKFPSAEKTEAYINGLVRQLEYFAPVFRGREFRHLYIGGGTPSVLGDKQLGKLLSAVFRNFSFSPGGQRTMEANPHTSRASCFGLLRGFGFNRVSFGVQSLNPAVLRANKRNYQSEDRIVEALKLAGAAGFEDINADLIAGLAGDTAAGFLYSFARLAKLAPNNIVVYGLMPPGGEYLGSLLKMTPRDYFMSHYPGLIGKILPPLSKLADKYGYVADSFSPSRWHWGFRHKNHTGVDMLGGYGGEYSSCIFGLGHGARSRIHDNLEYRETIDLDKPAACSAIFEGRLSDRREEMIRFIISRLDRGFSLPAREFFDIFGVSIEGGFPYAIAALRSLRRLKETPEGFECAFKRPAEKYVSGLFFFSELNAVGLGDVFPPGKVGNIKNGQK